MRIIFQAMRFETVLIAMSSPIISSSATLESSLGPPFLNICFCRSFKGRRETDSAVVIPELCLEQNLELCPATLKGGAAKAH